MKNTIAQIFHRSSWRAAALLLIAITAISSIRADVVTDRDANNDKCICR